MNQYFIRIASVLVVMAIMVACNIYTFIPIYGNIASSLSIAQSEVVIAGSSFIFFYACGLLTFANSADRVGKKEILVWGMLASAVSTGLVGIAGDFWSLFFTRGIQGFCLGSFAPVAFAYTYDLFSGRKRTLLLAFINSGFLFAGILGQLLSEGITRYSNWTIVFFFFAVVYASLFLMGKQTLPATSTRSVPFKHQVNTIYKLLLRKELLYCYGIVFTLLASFVAYYDSLTRYLSGDSNLLFLLRAVGLIGVSLSLFTGRLLEAIGAYKTLFIGVTISITSVLIAFIYVHLSEPFLIVLSSVLFISAISLLIPTVITLIGDMSGDDRSQALSLYSFILLGGTSIAPLVIMQLTYVQSLFLLLGCFLFHGWMGGLLYVERRRWRMRE
ncbi:MFS transporter [Rossellomorea yichunensis]|jgi:predicted MFS family arabinose efflux permease|uniref:MFS transporter n=1 Tax=Rossellomorea yichunensis TaxID=3077331 RepID=UPI0028DE5880|nr:MFS transporter [Rossellomorea sp. YC4-1]MDT9023536.1 MFS transporter [Rossellomorea sp. YC4-1]